MKRVHIWRTILGLAIATSVSATATTSASGTHGVRGPTDRAELEAFLDGLMLANMRDTHIAGAVVSVVKDGELFFAKGYGFADVERRQPVDPQRTLFRIGSVSKLFTWTSVMQLVEQGQLDLDADVNQYLDFKIPATYPQPITLRHIMTHTAGFEEDVRGLWTTNPEGAVPIGPWLSRHLPGRVRPPGAFAAYSNYATALAAHIVERVSGLNWQEYEEQHILRPLGMAHTTGRQLPPETLRADLSQGYSYRNGRFEAQPFEVITGMAPAGAISASATDMATFMLAHLGDGAIGDRRILGEATARAMHARTFAHDPRLPGFALGFYEQSSHDLRIIGHGGTTQWFHSNLTLIPSERLGVFVSYNTDTGHELSIGPFLREFLDHYYPVVAAPVIVDDSRRTQAQRIAGEYRFNRMSYTTFQRALGLVTPIEIAAEDDGSMRMTSTLGHMRLVPVGPWLYREELGSDLVAFKTDERGRVTHGFLGSIPVMAMERVPWYQSTLLHRAIMAVATVVFLLIVGSTAARVLRRRAHVQSRSLSGRVLVTGAAVANLAFVLAIVIAMLNSNVSIALATDSSSGLALALALPVIALLLALAAVWASVKQWIDRAGTPAARVRYAVVTVVCLLFTWSLSEWNLLGWKL